MTISHPLQSLGIQNVSHAPQKSGRGSKYYLPKQVCTLTIKALRSDHQSPEEHTGCAPRDFWNPFHRKVPW